MLLLSFEVAIKRHFKDMHVLHQALKLFTFSAPVVRTLKEHVSGFIFIRDMGSKLGAFLLLTFFAGVL